MIIDSVINRPLVGWLVGWLWVSVQQWHKGPQSIGQMPYIKGSSKAS